MSKFIEAVTAQLTHRERPVIPDLCAVVKNFGKEISLGSIQYEYRISVTYERKVFCGHEDIKRMVENTVDTLKHEVYGDLRHRLLALQRAVLERDSEAANSHIRDILSECFG